MGHFIDSLLNGKVDTQGDEGEAFASAVYNIQLSDTERQRIATEDDQLWIQIDDQDVQVEMAALLFNGKVFNLTADVNLEQNIITLGSALKDGTNGTGTNDITRTLFVSDPESAATYSGNNVRGWLYTIDSADRVVQKFYGEMSRQQKIGSTTVGLQFYIYPSGTITNVPAKTLLIDVKGNDTFVPTTGSMQGTSSDPIAAALNAMLPKPVPVIAPADRAEDEDSPQAQARKLALQLEATREAMRTVVADSPTQRRGQSSFSQQLQISNAQRQHRVHGSRA